MIHFERTLYTAAVLALLAAQSHAQYEIELNVRGLFESFTQRAFKTAADRWSSVVTDSLEPVTDMDGTDQLCGKYPATIDNLYICGRWIPIDFFGGVLGFAGPTVFRQGSNIPAAGIMAFDKFDLLTLLASRRLNGVIVHEMGHIMGVGTTWVKMGLTGPMENDCPYNAESNASKEFREISGCDGAIPTETDGGQGTKCGHWDEECLKGELMTGYASGDLKLSRITVGTLHDMGYKVNYDSADPLDESELGTMCQCKRRKLEAKDENPRARMLRMRDQAKKTDSERELSPAAQAAVAFGKQHLLESSSVHYANIASESTAWKDQVYYVGDIFVNVFYREGSQVKEIGVWADF